MLDALPWPAIVLDEKGTIRKTNEEWKSAIHKPYWLFTRNSDTNYFDHCGKKVEHGNDYALRLIFSIREVLDGVRQKSEVTVICDEPLAKKWCKVSISSLQKPRPAVMLIFTNVTSNRNAIAALRESEEKYSKQFEYSVSGIIISNKDGGILDANPAACAILGYTKQELMQGGRSLFVTPENLNSANLSRQAGGNISYKQEEEYYTKDGTVIPVEAISASYRDGQGNTRFIYTFRDKSGERIVQHSLDDERRFSQIILNNIPGIFLVINKKLGLVQWNNILSHELGYAPEELDQIHIIDLFEKSDKEWVQNALYKIFRTGAGNFVANILSKREGIRPYHLYFNTFRRNDQVYLVATAVDKTDHFELESERERNFELMSQLFEKSPLAKVMIETNGRVLKANRSFIDLFGYTKKELIGQNVNPLIAGKEHLHEAEEINKNASRGISHQQKTIRIDKQNERIPVILSTVPVLYEKKVIAVFGIYVDMREQINLENKLHRTIQEKDTLLQEVHHRVKNNLAIVLSLLDLQILQEENESVVDKLYEVHSRIYSIAKIHETLYQADSMVMVDFGQYLDLIRHTIPGLSEIEYNIPSESDSEATFHLNMNQAVPLGIVIHELIRFSKKNNWYDTDTIQIRMRRTGDQTEISITGLGIFSEAILKDKEYTYQYLLMKIFLEQIDATISQGEKWNEIVIRFQKNDAATGTNNALL